MTDVELINLIVNDPIKRNQEIADFISLIEKIEGGYSIFLNASWGDGKTVFVKQAALVLRALNAKLESDECLCSVVQSKEGFSGRDHDGLYMPVYYNSWKNDSLGDPLPTLIASIATEYDLHELEKEGPVITQAVTGILDALLKPLNLNILAELKSATSGKDYLAAYEERKELQTKVSCLIEAALAERANKLVLFIDELDRCSPIFALRLLEELKFLFENDKVILIFSTDMQQLASVISGAYGESFDGAKYLGRFYDRIIPLSKPAANIYLETLGLQGRLQRLNSVVTDIANISNFSMRETNCFYESMDKVRGILSEMTHTDSWATIFFCTGIIPVLQALKLTDIVAFTRVVNNDDSQVVASYLKKSAEFRDLNNIALSSVASSSLSSNEYTEGSSHLIFDLCSVAFCSDTQCERYRTAYQRLGYHASQIPYLVQNAL